jgi:plastocyanin
MAAMLDKRFVRVLGTGSVILAAVLGACSDDAPPVSPGGSSGTSGGTSGGSGSSGDGGASGSDGSSGNGGETIVNGCRTFEDRTADDADRTIPWDFEVFDRPERCMQIKVGQTVTFAEPGDGGAPADFLEHPPGPQGGDSPNPIASIDKATGKVTFDQPGVFGYVCLVHGAMTGAILVGP